MERTGFDTGRLLSLKRPLRFRLLRNQLERLLYASDYLAANMLRGADDPSERVVLYDSGMGWPSEKKEILR